MYGTIARMRPKAGHEQEVLDLMEQWNRGRKPKVHGAVGSYMLRPDRDPHEVVLMAVFESREMYGSRWQDRSDSGLLRRPAVRPLIILWSWAASLQYPSSR